MVAAPVALTGSRLLTETVTDAVLLQVPVAPVTEYVMVDVGLAIADAPPVPESPVEGLQIYDVAPVAVSTVDEPVQMVTSVPAYTTGVG
jgi:hypothetical protein